MTHIPLAMNTCAISPVHCEINMSETSYIDSQKSFILWIRLIKIHILLYSVRIVLKLPLTTEYTLNQQQI